jgi:o-succinylbenzoate synthase
MARLLIHRYALPLRRPWHTARGLMTRRQGFIVVLEQAGDLGIGDCAPLPMAGTESLQQARARLQYWQGRLQSGRWDSDRLLAALSDGWPSTAPAADAAVETAALDLAARRRVLPLRGLLTEQPRDQVQVNAVLGPLTSLSPEALDPSVAAGWRCLKIKVGIAPIDDEIARLRTLTARMPPGVRYRLDANGAWSGADAERVIAAMADLPIDALEEPLNRPRDAELASLQAAATFPLALDESLAGRWPIDPAQLPVRRLVLKPGVVGGLRPTLALARAASAAGRQVVLTSLIESAVGLWATAQLAAALPEQEHHGLATANWLAHDLATAPNPVAGVLALPDEPGIGIDPTSLLAALQSGQRP